MTLAETLSYAVVIDSSANYAALHNVHFVDFVFLPTEQAATYLKICISTYLLTYIDPSSFDWKENTFFFCEFQTLNLQFRP